MRHENLKRFATIAVTVRAVAPATNNSMRRHCFDQLKRLLRMDNVYFILHYLCQPQKEDDFADKIASMFLQGRNHALLFNKIADFYLDQISLAGGWIDMIRNKNIMSSVVRKQLVGEYTDLKGEYIETAICDILGRADIAFEKGQVPLLGKEADLAIPSCADPCVIVMSSYQETTSSSQTQRANE